MPTITNKQRAAQMRASQIRSLRGIRTQLIDDVQHREIVEKIIDQQLASMGAETNAERRARWNAFVPKSDKDWDEFNKTGKPYKITDADVRRYRNW